MEKQTKYIEDLKMIRKAAGLTQAELAALVGKSFDTITKYENGYRRISKENYDQLIKACQKQIAKNTALSKKIGGRITS